MATTISSVSSTTTDVLMPSMTLTPGAGDWIVILTASIQSSNQNEEAVVTIYHDNVPLANTVRYHYSHRTNRTGTVTSVAHLTGVQAGETIEAYWRTLSGNTMTLRNRSLTVIQVD